MSSPKTISVYEVPQSDWETFCARMSSEHRGKAVEVLRGPSNAASLQVMSQMSPTRAFTFHEMEFAENRVLVRIGQQNGEQRAFSIEGPSSIRFEQLGEQGPGQLRIRTRDAALVLRFGQPLVAGVLDGVP